MYEKKYDECIGNVVIFKKAFYYILLVILIIGPAPGFKMYHMISKLLRNQTSKNIDFWFIRYDKERHIFLFSFMYTQFGITVLDSREWIMKASLVVREQFLRF